MVVDFLNRRNAHVLQISQELNGAMTRDCLIVVPVLVTTVHTLVPKNNERLGNVILAVDTGWHVVVGPMTCIE